MYSNSRLVPVGTSYDGRHEVVQIIFSHSSQTGDCNLSKIALILLQGYLLNKQYGDIFIILSKFTDFAPMYLLSSVS